MSPDPGITLYPRPDQLRRINREFVLYVRSHFPKRFYGRYPGPLATAAAALLRMCDAVESIMVLLSRSKDSDAQVLLRALYELLVRFAWVAVDPEARHVRWLGHAMKEDLKLHNDALDYGQTILSPAQVQTYTAAVAMPTVAQMAHEADEHWAPRVAGFHSAGDLLSIRGLYLTAYRVTSRSVHASVQALDSYMIAEPEPPTVSEAREGKILTYSALAAPLLGMALIIGAKRFDWIDESRVRNFVDRATAETTRRRERQRS
jgi:hypothetical protein